MSSILQRANQLFRKHALVGSMCVYSALYAGGDQTRQMIQQVDNRDFASSGRMGIVGGLFLAPAFFKWYQFLDGAFQGTAIKVVVKKTVLDQLLASSTGIVIFYTGMSILEGKQNVFEDLQQKGLKTYLTGCMFWPVVQVLNFSFAPPHLRTALVASAGFVWCIILSYYKSSEIVNKDTTEN